MQTISKQQLAVKLANKMTTELMEVTQLSRQECLSILTKQLSDKIDTRTYCLLITEEYDYISSLFH